MGRSAWLGVLGACCLSVGCLFHRAGETVPPPDPPPEVQPPPEPAPPPVERPIQSTYQVHPVQPVARLSASVEPPVERVNLEVKPAGPPVVPAVVKAPVPIQPLPDEPVVAAMRCALRKQPQQARKLLEKYDPADREALLALCQLAVQAGGGALDRLAPQEAAQLLEKLGPLAQRLRARAPLALGEVCFCRRIESFGQYVPLPVGHAFQAGSDGQPGECVQVYVEVRNFRSVRRQDHYETVLNSSLEIIDHSLELREEQRRRVVCMDLGTCTDTSRTPRQDYFLNFQFHVPARLPPGLYTLRVTVKDVTPAEAGPERPARVAQRSLDFRVNPPGTVSVGTP